MDPSEVLEVLDLLGSRRIEACIDGGWGVDALVGEQTRAHDDLDLVVDFEDVPGLIDLLETEGFGMLVDEMPTRFEMGHPDGRRIDVHPVRYEEDGAGVQVLPENRSYRYPPDGLRGSGSIMGRTVRCIDARTQLECHLGYDPDEKDRHDVAILVEKFRLAVPEVYGR